MRKQDRGGKQQHDSDDPAAIEGKSVAAQQHGNAADAENQRRDIHELRPDAGQRPGQQRGPDRHGVDDQRAFADGDELHRHRAKTHPRKDIGEGREQQPRHRLARDFKRLRPRPSRSQTGSARSPRPQVHGKTAAAIAAAEASSTASSAPIRTRSRRDRESRSICRDAPHPSGFLAGRNQPLHPGARMALTSKKIRRALSTPEVRPARKSKLVVRARGRSWPRSRGPSAFAAPIEGRR